MFTRILLAFSIIFSLIGSNAASAAVESSLIKIGVYGSTRGVSKGEGVVVAVIDEGVWLEHPTLKANIWTNNSEVAQGLVDKDGNGYVGDYYGWNFVDNNADMVVKGTHGTAVAGIVASTREEVGVAPAAKIMSLIACSSNGCPRDAVKKAIKYAVDMGADVINLSLGGRGYVGYDAGYDEFIKYAYDKGVVVVASAGNGDLQSNSASGVPQVGQNLDFVKASPVSNDVGGVNMVVGVGASNGDRPLMWSNYGNVVDVWSPGESVFSTTVPSLSDGYGYDYFSGTSFSAPLVSGVAALIISKNPDWKNWQVIDFLKLKQNLNVQTLFSASQPQCVYTTVSPAKINVGEKMAVAGEHFTPKMLLQLNNSLTGNIIGVPNKAVHFVDATKLLIDTALFNLPVGVYTISDANSLGYTCRRVGTFSVAVESVAGANAESINPSSNRTATRSPLYDCMSKATLKRQESIVAVYKQYSIKQNEALESLQRALSSAWELDNLKDINKLTSNAYKSYRVTKGTITKNYSSALNLVWQKYNSDAKICKPGKVLPVDIRVQSDNSL